MLHLELLYRNSTLLLENREYNKEIWAVIQLLGSKLFDPCSHLVKDFQFVYVRKVEWCNLVTDSPITSSTTAQRLKMAQRLHSYKQSFTAEFIQLIHE